MAKMIYRPLTILPFGTNCYLVASEQTRDGMVIDPAGDADRILSNITELGLHVGIIVITHSHADHIGAVLKVKESTGAVFAIHNAEAKVILQGKFGRFASHIPGFVPPPPPDKLLQDGDTITVGDLSFKVLHTPGHSAGGICLVG